MTDISYLTDRIFLFNVARMYHENGLNQEEISKRLGLSRPQVSRCLKKAKDIGIVEITVNSPLSRDYEDLGERLTSALGLKHVVIARIAESPEKQKNDPVDAISISASRFLPELIKRSKHVGVGWGKTVYKTVLAMEFSKEKAGTIFVPLVGSIGMKAPHYQVNSIVDRLAEKFKSESIFINNPAFMADARARDLAMNDESFSAVVNTWKEIDTAVVGLGSFIADSSYLENELKKDVKEQLVAANAVGDILGQFFDKNGVICKSDLEHELLGMNIEDLRLVENVVCLSGGVEKVKGIIAAANKHYFNILLTDDITASEILSNLEDNE
ncbi:MAG: winged helix-turn-helix transcriptional regulator [Spirochaetales bacterium]|nr:winged helix-turn-helix transcriptional regulator [Spirochaetales bacterium]